jgi:hypothetical protein
MDRTKVKEMNKSKFGLYLWLLLLIILAVNMASAEGLSVSLKRTNPGIIDVKSAELIFDVVNTDPYTKIEGFILCQSPDDLLISSTLGASQGSGSQYLSPRFIMEEAPSQQSIYLTLESGYPGDYSANCILKYIPFKTMNNESIYVKMNLDETANPFDSDYRQIRLDKNIPFISVSNSDVYCPPNKAECRVSELVILRAINNRLLEGCIIVLSAAILVMLLIIIRKRRFL